MMSLLWSSMFIGLRLALVLGVFWQSGVMPFCFGVSEALALLVTVYALAFGKRDTSWLGLWVPVAYLLPLLFDLSVVTGPDAAMGLYILLVPWQWAFRLLFGMRCTVGVPCFVSLARGWPYTWVRHPMSLVELLLCALIGVRFFSLWNICVFGAYALSSVATVIIEEKFLLRVTGLYALYCRRVVWRWIPGLW